MRSYHHGQIERLAAEIAARYAASGDARHAYVATGHAATYRDTPQLEYMANAIKRAVIVAHALRTELSINHGIEENEVSVILSTASNTQPRAGLGYGTVRERALQRRVNISGGPVTALRRPPPPRLADAFNEAAESQCHKLVVAHVLDPDKSSLYLKERALSRYLAEAIVPADFNPYGHRVANTDAGAQLRRNWRKSREWAAELRITGLKDLLDVICGDIGHVIYSLPNLTCDNPKSVNLRLDVFKRGDAPITIYGTPPFSMMIADQKSAMSGLFGERRPELHCGF